VPTPAHKANRRSSYGQLDGRVFSSVYLSGRHIICSTAGRHVPCLREYVKSLCANHVFHSFYLIILFAPQRCPCSGMEQSPPRLAGHSDYQSISSVHLGMCKAVRSARGGEGGRESNTVEFSCCDLCHGGWCHGSSLSDCVVDVFRSIFINSLPCESRVKIYPVLHGHLGRESK